MSIINQTIGLLLAGLVLMGDHAGAPASWPPGPNHQPVVEINTPRTGTTHPWHTLLRYRIRVSDPEDGESQYQEIPADEVLLKVAYVRDAAGYRSDTAAAPVGLRVIQSSNCLNCHAFKSSSIGPAFSEISNRYADEQSHTTRLVNHIRKGSSGVWGAASMPSHPELTPRQVRAIVGWIMRYGADKNVTYHTGTEGTFAMTPPEIPPVGAGFKLTASYTDHGTKTHPHQSLRGQNTVVIYGR